MRPCVVGPGHCPNEGVVPIALDGGDEAICLLHAVAYAIPDLGTRFEFHRAILAGGRKG